MDLEELRAFLAVADTGSMVAAAERLGLPRTTLRRRVEALEARVGSPLFFRGVQGALLSPAGVAVASGGRRVLDEATHLLSSARQVGDDATGTMRVVLPIGLPPHAMVPIYRTCRERHPRLRFDVVFREAPLAEEGADLLVHFGERVTQGPWVTRTLLPVSEELLASADYLARHGRPETLEDLAGHELLAWKRPGVDPTLLPTLDGGHVPVAPSIVSSDVHGLRQLALAGAGIAFVPDGRLPDPNAPPGALVRVLPDLVGRSCPIHVVVPEPLARAPQVRALQQSILDFLA